MTSKIAEYYYSNGCFMVQAYLPTQDVKGGVITVVALEGKYGKISLYNRASLSSHSAGRLLGGINSKDIVTVESLENCLLLFSDMPGISVKSILTLGASMSGADQMVNINARLEAWQTQCVLWNPDKSSISIIQQPSGIGPANAGYNQVGMLLQGFFRGIQGGLRKNVLAEVKVPTAL